MKLNLKFRINCSNMDKWNSNVTSMSGNYQNEHCPY